MSYKIAAASSDRKQIDRHFGHADAFLIIEVTDTGKHHFLETRNVKSPCNHGVHDMQIIKEAAQQLSDCKYILCEAIGSGAAAVLGKYHIVPLETDAIIDTAIDNIVLYEKRVKRLQHAVPK
ncbi:NifB/NifX family molybdenum-iron cluster-binding protein [Pectinatus frisingensis]|jgi:predicted Fe-Mo cluster-binding NifX family protein|uniref:NifB/NifX family molybdenum-iron cluster-binding protein n=1 Tax=Pectinatus frisingensis TaxID=865 RepID=UPI0015F3F2EC|nr:NifB/NifX family molybdenum-iron cluster-binding protein [Pectinatus frisingensis]